MMSTVSSNSMALPKVTKVPGIGSLLISTGLTGDECSLCGNFFESYKASNLALRLPCVDNQCDPCTRMWHIISSPTCLVCYGDFKCPRFTRKEAQKSLPKLIISARDTFQQASPLDSHIDSFLSFRDRHTAFHSADAGPEDDTSSSPGSPMREDDDVPAVPELSEDLLEALTLANNRVGTNFNFQDIQAGIPPTLLRDCTVTQLADRLTQACIMKVSDSGCDNASRHRSSLQSQKDNVDQGHCTKAKVKSSHRCMHCRKSFRSAGHLRQHMIVHTPTHRMCSVCGQVLGNANSRRIHERRHRETQGERKERLGKAKVERQRLRESSRGRVQNL